MTPGTEATDTDRRTVALGEARDRLEAEREELAEQVADLDEDATDVQVARLRRDGQETNRHATAVAWAVEQWGGDAEVAFQRLTAGRAARVDDYLQANFANAGSGARRNARVAMAVVEAPFYTDPSEGEGVRDFETRLQAVADQREALVDWLQAEADEFSSPDPGNSQSFADLVAAKRRTE